jgi:CubicO group peptidase (beta-lactamase class C family)
VTPLDPDLVAAACEVADRHLALRRRILRLPGVQAAVALGENLVWETAHGYADLEHHVELTARHVFRIASHSKTFTATVVLQLVEAGRLRLDDRIGDHLGELPQPVGAVTIRELLGHGSGITRDGADADHWVLVRPFPQAAALLASLGPGSAVRPAGERFKYSNIGYSLLGLVIEAVTGSSYADAVTAGVIDRLGLGETTPDLDERRVADYAVGHTAIAYDDRRKPIDHIATGAMAAATGFASTAADLARFFAAHRPGDERLLSDASKRLAQRDEWVVERADEHYGLGFDALCVAGRRVVGHSGGFPGQITRTLLDPDTGLAVAVLTNAIDGQATELARAVFTLVALAAGLHREQRPDDRHADGVDLSRFPGSYADIWHLSDVVRFGDRLWLTGLAEPDPGDNPVELVAESRTRARVVGGGTGYGSFGEPLDLELAEDGSVTGVRLPGGISALPMAAFSERMAAIDRVELGRG